MAMSDYRKTVKLSAETGISLQTVNKWWRFEGVNSGNEYALNAASKKLGIKRPAAKATGTEG